MLCLFSFRFFFFFFFYYLLMLLTTNMNLAKHTEKQVFSVIKLCTSDTVIK